MEGVVLKLLSKNLQYHEIPVKIMNNVQRAILFPTCTLEENSSVAAQNEILHCSVNPNKICDILYDDNDDDNINNNNNNNKILI